MFFPSELHPTIGNGQLSLKDENYPADVDDSTLKYRSQSELSGLDDDGALALDHEKKLDGFDLLNHS